MNKKQLFFKVFKKAEAKYGKSTYRLAADGWKEEWQTLITTIMSAQSRDETTIPIAENLYTKYSSLDAIANAPYKDILKVFKSLNYNRTKAKNVIAAAGYLLAHHKGNVPHTIEQLIEIPGVGRKTANLVLSEIHAKDAICVDTHVHRLTNVLGLVKTRTPHQTELALQKIAPQKYWSRINRIFVLWGKDIRGRDRKKIMKCLETDDMKRR
jgi:endonuclease-3